GRDGPNGCAETLARARATNHRREPPRCGWRDRHPRRRQGRPDGYTLVMMLSGISLPASTGYNLNKDFAPVGLIASTPILVMTHPSFAAKSLADVIALAKKEPGRVTVGTPPPPTINYFAAELFKSLTGAEVTIVS